MTKSEKINLTFTILGPILVIGFLGWLSWSFNARMTIESDAQNQFNADTYVSKNWYERNQDTTNRRLESLDQNVSKLQQDVAGLRGEMSATIRGRP